MGHLFTVRRAEWLPGVAILVVSVALAALLGSAVELRSWASYLALTLAFALFFGWLERQRDVRPARRPPRSRGRLKVVEAGRGTRYDLSRDDSTDDQKYVM
jgi:hypothetical protein